MEGSRQYPQVLNDPHFSHSQEVRGERWNWHLSSTDLMLKVYPTFRNGAVFDRQGHLRITFCNQYLKDYRSKPAGAECPGRLK